MLDQPQSSSKSEKAPSATVFLILAWKHLRGSCRNTSYDASTGARTVWVSLERARKAGTATRNVYGTASYHGVDCISARYIRGCDTLRRWFP